MSTTSWEFRRYVGYVAQVAAGPYALAYDAVGAVTDSVDPSRGGTEPGTRVGDARQGSLGQRIAWNSAKSLAEGKVMEKLGKALFSDTKAGQAIFGKAAGAAGLALSILGDEAKRGGVLKQLALDEATFMLAQARGLGGMAGTEGQQFVVSDRWKQQQGLAHSRQAKALEMRVRDEFRSMKTFLAETAKKLDLDLKQDEDRDRFREFFSEGENMRDLATRYEKNQE